MRKFLAFGDVHADFDTLWAALRSASCVDAQFMPTPPVQSGLFQVVLIGDLVHPKNEQEYARLSNVYRFNVKDPEHLLLAALEQIRQLERLKAYCDAAPNSVHVILGNHDDAVLNTNFVLGTSGGLVHVEFDPERGGIKLPDHLHAWMSAFPREIRVGGVQFAHVSPLPTHLYYDDLFYSDHSSKRWFKETPEYVAMAGLSFGVYGHTQIEEGILLDQENKFAMIDAMQAREYLELLIDTNQDDPLQSVRAVPF